MAKAGRKRKSGAKRYRNGRITDKSRADMRRKEQRDMLQESIKTRARHTGLSPERAVYPDAGTPYGILYLQDNISRQQRDAAEVYHETATRFMRIKGYPTPFVRSGAAAMVSVGGITLARDPDDETVANASRAFSAITNALMRAGLEIGTRRGFDQNPACKLIVHEICFAMTRDIVEAPLNEAELGNLRVGLNHIHRLLS